MIGDRERAAMAARGTSDLMPGLRVREDGWTAARTASFLAVLGQTGCVTDAARVVGMSRTAVNRARARFVRFDAACRDALGRALRGLEAVAYERAVAGRETVIIRRGEEVERRIAPSDAMLKLLIQRGDMAGAGAGEGGAGAPVDSRGRSLGPDDYITREENANGWSWISGRKTQEAKGAKDMLVAKLTDMRQRRSAREWRESACRRCHQPISPAAWEEIVRRGGGKDPWEAYGAGGEDC